ncbi:MAG: hypothetical protein AB7O98_11435 [Hyphomonadaceae bacterium]
MIASLALAATVGSANAETTWSVASGVDYSSGDYGGATDTEVLSVPLTFRARHDDWTFRASTSYLEITGPADVADIADGGGATGVTSRTGTERGLGDTNLAVSRTFRELGGTDFYFETTARVRLPTGDDDKGLGVGVTDYGLSGEVGLNQRGGGASLELTRRFLGDRTGVDRQDGWQISAATWLRAAENTTIGAFGSWREASIEGNDDPAQLGAYISQRVSPNVRLAFNAAAGLSDASADYMTGIRLTWRPSSDD